MHTLDGADLLTEPDQNLEEQDMMLESAQQSSLGFQKRKEKKFVDLNATFTHSHLSELERLINHHANRKDKKPKGFEEVTHAKIFGKPKRHTVQDVINACQASHPSVFTKMMRKEERAEAAALRMSSTNGFSEIKAPT